MASAAGYVGIGLYLPEYERLRAAGHSGAELRAIVADHGQQITEFEALRGWASSGEAHEKCRRHLETIDRMAEDLGPADHVQVIGPYEGDLDDAAAGFAMVCDRFAQHGMRAALEYFPDMSNIPDVTTALEIVERAGRPNGGLCVDSWHHFRTGDTFEALARVPAERVVGVQFNDGPLARVHPDYYTECTSYRELPGAGEFDLDRLRPHAGRDGRRRAVRGRGHLPRAGSAHAGRRRSADGRRHPGGHRRGEGRGRSSASIALMIS